MRSLLTGFDDAETDGLHGSLSRLVTRLEGPTDA